MVAASQPSLFSTLTCAVCGDGFAWPVVPGRKPKTCGTECAKQHRDARIAEWRRNNPETYQRYLEESREHRRETQRARHRRWYDANREQIIADVAQWRRANPERHNAAAQAWKKRNPEKVNAASRVYCAVRRGRLSNDPETRDYAKLIVNDPCVYCGEQAESVDHIEPLSRGGGDTWENLAPACISCNSQKHTMGLLEFLIRRRERGSVAIH